VYLHPWELDPQQPRIAGKLKSKLRHYTNLGKMESKLERLLSMHKFQPLRQLLSAKENARSAPATEVKGA
jgi:hypothetical protein